MDNNTNGESTPAAMPEPTRLLWEARSTRQAQSDLNDALRRIQAVHEQNPQAVLVCRIELDLDPA
jgi:hypothetical protein